MKEKLAILLVSVILFGTVLLGNIRGDVMNEEQLSAQIVEACSHHIDAWVNYNRGQYTTISLDGDFTVDDLIKIVELMKENGCE